jgi:hypothetical protein
MCSGRDSNVVNLRTHPVFVQYHRHRSATESMRLKPDRGAIVIDMSHYFKTITLKNVGYIKWDIPETFYALCRAKAIDTSGPNN